MDIAALLQIPYVQFILILVAGLAAGSFLHFVLRMVFGKLTAKTKTDLDDKILHIIIGPMYLAMMVAAVQVAVDVVTVLFDSLPWIKNVFFAAYTLIAAYALSRILSLLVSRWLHVQRQFEKTPKLLGKVISVIVYVIAILIILNKFSIEITPVIAALGVGGLAVGLALQGTLSNFFAGLHIISDQPVKVGDFVELDGSPISGYVEDIGWRSVRIKTLAGNVVIIPNAKLADSIITNYNLPESPVEIGVACGVSYGSDLDHVEKVALKVAKQIQESHEFTVRGFENTLRFNEFGDSNINFKVWFQVKEFRRKFAVAHEFIKALKKEFDKEGIEISYPVRKIMNG